MVACCVGRPHWVAAQESDGTQENEASSEVVPENAEASRRAREHFLQGMQHFEARHFRDAIHHFQLAANIVPSADLWFNIARAHEELNDEQSLQRAVQYFRRYLRDKVDPPDGEAVEARIERLEEHLESLRQRRLQQPTMGTLRISSEDEGANVDVDGRNVGQTPVAIPIALEQGTHRLEIDRSGSIPFRSEVQIEAGMTTVAYPDLAPAIQFRAIRGRRIVTWIVGGLGVATLATSIGLGVKARQFIAQDDLDTARRWSTRSDYLLGTTMALAVGALILYFIEGRAIGTEQVSNNE